MSIRDRYPHGVLTEQEGGIPNDALNYENANHTCRKHRVTEETCVDAWEADDPMVITKGMWSDLWNLQDYCQMPDCRRLAARLFDIPICSHHARRIHLTVRDRIEAVTAHERTSVPLSRAGSHSAVGCSPPCLAR